MQIDRQGAQRRADRIHAFREELADLEREGVLTLSAVDAARVRAHHEQLLGHLSTTFDVDVAAGQKSLSLGMRIAAAFGAAALAASVFLFFYRFWADLSTPAQVVLLVAAPLAGLVGMQFAARRERTLYITGVIGVVTVAAFVLNLSALGDIFNLIPSSNAFLAWSAFSIALAYAFRLRWPLAFGLVAFTVWVATSLEVWSSGSGLEQSFDRLETYLLGGVLVLLVGASLPEDDLSPTWRWSGWLVVFATLLGLSASGESLLPISSDTARSIYQFGGMAVTAGAIALAVKRKWPEIVNLGSLFFAGFLLTRLADWLWKYLPSYVFFFVIGLLAIGLIVLFRRLRARTAVRS